MFDLDPIPCPTCGSLEPCTCLLLEDDPMSDAEYLAELLLRDGWALPLPRDCYGVTA